MSIVEADKLGALVLASRAKWTLADTTVQRPINALVENDLLRWAGRSFQLPDTLAQLDVFFLGREEHLAEFEDFVHRLGRNSAL